MAPLNLTGATFNFWTVRNGPSRIRKRLYWECVCTCGAIRNVDGSNLKNGISKSCGCQHKPHTSTAAHKLACAENSRAKAAKLLNKQLENIKVSSNGCWEWQAGKDKDGYGKVKRFGKTIRTHRLFYEYYVEPIPEGLLALHHCDNPGCCNPEHLYLGTQLDNEHDKDSRGRRRNGYTK